MKVERREDFVLDALVDGLFHGHIAVTVRTFQHYGSVEARMKHFGFKPKRRILPFLKPSQSERLSEARRLAHHFTAVAVNHPNVLREFRGIICVWMSDTTGHWQFDVLGAEPPAKDDGIGIILAIQSEIPRYKYILLGTAETPDGRMELLDERISDDDPRIAEIMERFRFDFQDGDEVWTYSTKFDDSSEEIGHFESGYALVRGKRVVKMHAELTGTG